MLLDTYLKTMMAHEASDLYLLTGAPASIRVQGKLQEINSELIMPPGKVKELAYSIMRPEQIEEFEKQLEMNLALELEDVGRFRVNIYKQRNETSMVIRSIKAHIPDWRSLELPEVLTEVIMEKRGLILFVGATGTGKSTSMASLIKYRNENSTGHIITVEDPIEYVHAHAKNIITQREIGMDTLTYEAALKNTLRQAPDVIQIGEVRDAETMTYAMQFAETGHLCISTLHANNANQAIERVRHFFPEAARDHLLFELSINIVGIISQRLIPTIDGQRAPAFEILLGTPLVKDFIKRNEVTALKDVMQKSEHLGMQTFDMSLLKLYDQGRISIEEAIRNADSANNLRLAISLKEGTTGEGADKLSMEERPEDEIGWDMMHPLDKTDGDSEPFK